MNPYQVLGVSQTADEDTIKKAYRKAAKECHPDTHPGDKRAEERFKEIGEAYRILILRRRMDTSVLWNYPSSMACTGSIIADVFFQKIRETGRLP